MKIVDSYMIRFNQATVCLFSLLGFLSPIFWGLMSLQLLTTFFFGQKYCLICRFYQLLIKGGFVSKGPLEDARPPKLANLIGAVFLGLALTTFLTGLTSLAFVFAAGVGILSLVSAVTGFCLGCRFYLLLARARGVEKVKNIKPSIDDFLGFQGLVLFTYPLCHDCQKIKERLDETRKDYLEIDVSKKTDLAKKYGVTVVPTLYLVEKEQVKLIDI